VQHEKEVDEGTVRYTATIWPTLPEQARAGKDSTMLRQREESSGFFHGMNANVTVPSDDPHSLLLTAQLLPAWQPPALWAAAALSLL